MAEQQSMWDRISYVASAFFDRIADEGGWYDASEALAKYDDEDMTAAQWFRSRVAAYAQGVTAPFDTGIAMAGEAVRFMGAVRGVWRNQALPMLVEGQEEAAKDPNFQRNYLTDYFSGGISPEQREVYRQQGMPADQLRRRYEPASYADMIAWRADHIRNTAGTGAMMLTPHGWIYKIGEIFNPIEGKQRNGSYLPAAFDIWAPDAGVQLWERSDMTHQLIASQVVVESAVDPLNFLATPIAVGIKGATAPRLIARAGELVDSARAAQELSRIGNVATDMNRWQRAAQWAAGRGTWNGQRMLTNMARNPRVYSHLQRLAETKDATVIRRMLDNDEIALGEGADALASVIAVLDDPQEVGSLLYAAAYRDEAAFNRIIARLEHGVDNAAVANTFRTLTGGGKNVLESAFFEFGNGFVPNGHLLTTRAGQFVDDAITRFDAMAGVEAGTPGSLRAQWDALADATRQSDIADLERWQGAMRGAEQLIERSAMGEQIVTRMPTRGASSQARRAAAAQAGISPTRTAAFAEYLRTHVVPSISVHGRSMRTAGTVYLMAKPGLVFDLHGVDAFQRVEGLVKYADGIIGSAQSAAPRGAFADLPEVRALLDEFIAVGADTRAPQQARAEIVNRLQQLAIQKIGEARGIHPAAAEVLADAGMKKSRRLVDGMNAVDSGYASNLLEDGRPVFFKSHPSTLRQTANHVPIMDLKALDDALKARGTQQAFTVGGNQLSVATAEVTARATARNLVDQARGTMAKYGTERDEDILRNVGRSDLSAATHMIVDMADEANTIFKAWVLLRLGYGFRNITEAHLSAFASGVGWLGVLRHADLPYQFANFLYNRRNAPFRMVDRVMVNRGYRLSDDGWVRLGESALKARNHAGDRVAQLAAVASNPDTLDHLVEAVNRGGADADVAAQQLRTIFGWRAKMAHHLTEDMIDSGLIPDPTLADDLMSSAAYFHADTSGAFDETAGFDRPISVVENPVVAQAAVDGAWNAGPAWAPAPQWTPGALTGAQQFPIGTLTPAQRAIVNEVTGSIGRNGGFRVQSGADMDAAMGAIDVEVADLRDRAADLRDLSNRNTLTAKEAERAARAAKQQVVDDAAAAGQTWIADEPDRSIVRGLGTTVTKADDGTYVVREDAGWGNDGAVLGRGYPTQLDAKVAVVRGDVRQPSGPIRRPKDDPDYAKEYRKGRAASQRWGRSPGAGESPLTRADAEGRPDAWYHGYEDHAAGRPIWEGPEQELAVHEYVAPPAPVKADGPSMKRQAATLDQRRRALEKARDSLNMQAQWSVRQKSLEKAAKTNRVQWRRNPQSDWVDWKPQHTATYRDGFNPEFRTIPGTGAKPRKVQIDAWSPMIDLTDTRVVDAVIANYPDFPVKTLGEARAGDRAAQEKLMDVFAKEGFYRVKFPEPNPAWNGEHVMLHPDAIGERAFRRHVEEMFERATDPSMAPRTGRSLLADYTSQSQRRMLNAGQEVREESINKPAALQLQTPGSMRNVARVLENGGFEPLMDEAIGTVNRLNAEIASIEAGYLTRAQQVKRRAKRHGARAKEWRIPTRFQYNGEFALRVNDATHGHDGGAFAQVTSSQVQQHLVYSQGAHHSDLMADMERAMLDPEEIHPGSPRFWEGMANFLGRHGRDTPGARTPMGVQTADIDPVLLRAMERGDREQQVRDTIEWVLRTPEGREWARSMDLEIVGSVDEAIKRADAAMARRMKDVKPAVTRAQRREVVSLHWSNLRNNPTVLTRPELAEVIRAQFNFVDTHLPTDRARDLFRSGNATADSLRRAWEVEPWQLQPFNGLLSPTHAAFRKSIRQQRANQAGMGRLSSWIIEKLGKGLEAVGTKPETMLARHPVYQQIVYTDLKQRIAFAEATQSTPLTMDQVLRLRSLSQQYGVRQLEKTLYTMKSRSSVDEFMRFVMPFFPAWKNTVHRWGRFSMENPARIAQLGRIYQTTIEQLPYYDFTTGEQVFLGEGADPDQSYTLLPGIAAIPFIGRMLPDGLKEAMSRTKVNLGTWDVIFQGEPTNPGMGPLVAITVQEFMDRNQELYDSPMGKAIVKGWLQKYGPAQTGKGSAVDALYAWLPSAAKPLANSLFDTNQQKALRIKIGATYVANGYDQNPDGTYKTQQQIDAEINHAVMIMNLTRVFSYLTSPIATQPVGEQDYYAAQYRAMREAYEDDDEAANVFLQRFGHEKFLYTQSLTENYTGGQATSAVVANQRDQRELQQEVLNRWDNPKALGFFENLSPDGVLMPYDPEAYNPYSRNWQMRNAPAGGDENWRSGKELQDYLEDADVSLGWRYYDEGMDRIEMSLSQQGFVQGTQEWAAERSRRGSALSAYVGQLVPRWADSRSVIDTDRTEKNADMFWWAINESEWGRKNAGLPIVKSMAAYLQIREWARAQISYRNSLDPSHPNTLGAEKNADIAAEVLYLRERLSQDSPTFKQWVDQFFRTDDVAYAEEKFPGQSEVEAITR